MGIASGVLLVVLGFAIAIIGVLAGVISQGQLIALFTGANPTVDPAGLPPPAVAASVAAPQPAAEPAPQPAAAASVPPPRVLRDEVFGDWRFVCVEAADAAATCSATQQLLVAETGAAVFIWRIAQDGHGGLVGMWQAPETVLLSAGLTLEAGTPQPIVMPFSSCGGGSCQVVANLAPDFLASLSAATKLSASVVLANGQPLTFPLSHDGIADALAALAASPAGSV
jgi:invasion protein IalB